MKGGEEIWIHEVCGLIGGGGTLMGFGRGAGLNGCEWETSGIGFLFDG
jgi:hypothetical protein